MAFKYPDASEFELHVNGVDMMIGMEMLKEVTVIENTNSLVPSVTMTFLDNKRAAGSFGVFTDGAQLDLVLGDGKRDPRQYQFVQWSLADATTNTAGDLATLTGVANIVPWFRKVHTKSIKDTAANAIEKLAQDNGVQNTDIDNTDDKMTWLPDSRAICQAARKIADHAWSGEQASMFLAMTSDNGQWMMRFKDILKDGGGGGKKLVSAGMATQNDYIIWDYRINSDAMFYNTWINYGYKVSQEKLDGTLDIFKDMNIDKIASELGINEGIKKAVDTVRSLYHPPDVGNTHDNYAKAHHHNIKAQATYTTTVHVLLAQMTDYKLLDDVEIKLAKSDGSVDPAYSGKYKITGISRHISKGEYREKMVLMSQGTGQALGGMI